MARKADRRFRVWIKLDRGEEFDMESRFESGYIHHSGVTKEEAEEELAIAKRQPFIVEARVEEKP